jgi:hypothetical protein
MGGRGMKDLLYNGVDIRKLSKEEQEIFLDVCAKVLEESK